MLAQICDLHVHASCTLTRDEQALHPYLCRAGMHIIPARTLLSVLHVCMACIHALEQLIEDTVISAVPVTLPNFALRSAQLCGVMPTFVSTGF